MVTTLSMEFYKKNIHGLSEMSDIDRNALFVFPTHSAEWKHNMSKLHIANKTDPVAKI